MKYDIIGDIHGRADKLKEMLERLGYEQHENVYQHPSRQVIFLGDFIDGKVEEHSAQAEVIHIVKNMVNHGSALAVMGNHEFNAICYATPTSCGTPHLREHSDKNQHQHHLFLKEYEVGSTAHDEAIAWFKTLPVYLDLDDVFIIHACPSLGDIDIISPYLNADNILTEEAYHVFATKADKPLHDAIERVLKGVECTLPDGLTITDSYGHVRRESRVKWWVDQNQPISARVVEGKVSFSTEEKQRLDASENMLEPLTFPDKPCFVGHYWLTGQPDVLSARFACVDYSVGRTGGNLACYRFNGESTLSKNNFVTV